jgi:hypothetical protein
MANIFFCLPHPTCKFCNKEYVLYIGYVSLCHNKITQLLKIINLVTTADDLLYYVETDSLQFYHFDIEPGSPIIIKHTALKENDGSGCPLLLQEIQHNKGALIFYGSPGAEEERYINIVDTAYYENTKDIATIVRLHINTQGIWWEAQNLEHSCHWAKTVFIGATTLSKILDKG